MILMFVVWVPASYGADYYLDANVDIASVEIGDESFNPLLAEFKFGVKATDYKLLRGVGLELVVAQPISDDEVDGFSVDVSQYLGIYSTFTHDMGRADFSLKIGYASTELQTQSNILNNSFSEELDGVSYGLTFRKKVDFIDNLGWSVDCSRIVSKDNISISSCGLGVSYEF